MKGISIIYADDGSKWGEFLSQEINNLGAVYQYVVGGKTPLKPTEMNQDVNCIILSPNMFHSHKNFIQTSSHYVENPIIVLCGVPRNVMSQSTCCKPWKQCMILTVTSSEDSADHFYRTVEKRLIEQNISHDVMLVPDTFVDKANQTCVLMFSETVFGEVEVLIKDHPKKLMTKKKDTKTYIFNVPRLSEGNHEVNIFVSNKMVPKKYDLTVIKPKIQKCACDYICQMLDTKDFKPLDKVLTSAMENDYSNRLFYQNVFKPNPDLPEFPTVFHFATKHGMSNVLTHLMNLPVIQPNVGRGLNITNNRDKNCLDIAKDTNYSSTLVPILNRHCDDSTYMDMSNNTYMHMADNNKRQKTSVLRQRQNLAYLLKG